MDDCTRLTVSFTAKEWIQADIPALRFKDSLSMGEWLLVSPERQRLTVSIADWASLSAKLGLRWEIAAVRPAQGHEVKHKGVLTLLLASLELNERDLDALNDLSLQPDSFVSLTSASLCGASLLHSSARSFFHSCQQRGADAHGVQSPQEPQSSVCRCPVCSLSFKLKGYMASSPSAYLKESGWQCGHARSSKLLEPHIFLPGLSSTQMDGRSWERHCGMCEDEV